MKRATARSSAVMAAVLVLVLDGCAVPRWPVDAPVTSPFGLRMVGLRPRVHHGVDLGVPEGTPVHAMTRGRVAFAGAMGGYGLTVILEHRGGVSTLYAHLSEISVRPGDRVGARQVIGRSGRTGAVRGAHLHFEVRRRGRLEDPVPLLGGPPRAGRR